MWMHACPIVGPSVTARLIIQFPAYILQQTLFICHLEVLNAMVALKMWAPKLTTQLVHLFCDNVSAVAGRGMDTFLQACTREVWLTCSIWDITLAISHVAGESLTDSANALSRWHLGQMCKDRVSALVKDMGVTLFSMPEELVLLSEHL